MRDQYKVDNPGSYSSVNRSTPVNPQNMAQNPSGKTSVNRSTPLNPKNQANNPRYNTKSMNRNARPSQEGTVKPTTGHQVVSHDTLRTALNKDRTVC